MPENIRSLAIKNLARLTEIEIEPAENGLIPVVGKNGAGKTSLLKAIVAGFGGEVPPLREGKKRGEVKIETDSLRIKLIVTPRGERMEVTVKDSAEKVSSPKTAMKALFGKRSFDLLDFLRAKPRQQIEALLRVIDVKVNDKKIKEICNGLATVNANANLLDKINSAYSQIMEERKYINRDLKQSQILLSTLLNVEFVAPVDIGKLYEKKSKVAERVSVLEKIAHNNEKIKMLQAQLNTASEEGQTLQASLELIPDFEASEIDREIEQAKEINIESEQYKTKEKEKVKLAKAKKKADNMTEILKNIVAYKNELMENTQFPIDGLDISQGQIFYNGLPLKDASGAEQAIVAIAIAAQEIPSDGIQALFVFDPPQLDSESWQKIETFAKEKSFQLWIAKVTDNPEPNPSQIILHEGALVDQS